MSLINNTLAAFYLQNYSTMEDNTTASVFTVEQSRCLRYVFENLAYALVIDGHATDLFGVMQGACDITRRDPAKVSTARNCIAQNFTGVSVATIGQTEVGRLVEQISAVVTILHGTGLNHVGREPTGGVLPFRKEQQTYLYDNDGDTVMVQKEKPLCKLCTCTRCQRRIDRANRKGRKTNSIQTSANAFGREDLLDILDAYWLTLQNNGLYPDQFRSQFQNFSDPSNAADEFRHYHVIPYHLDPDDELYALRRFVAEYNNLESYKKFQGEVARQRVDNMQVRKRGDSDRNRSHREYVQRMFPDALPKVFSEHFAIFKRALVRGRRLEIFVDGYTDSDGTEIPGLGLGVLFVHRTEINKKMFVDLLVY